MYYVKKIKQIPSCFTVPFKIFLLFLKKKNKNFGTGDDGLRKAPLSAVWFSDTTFTLLKGISSANDKQVQYLFFCFLLYFFPDFLPSFRAQREEIGALSTSTIQKIIIFSLDFLN